ncbi:hypothetical protein F4826_004421 [Rahnella inusitata]|nr:hypothetical protein [Rahnella inusitata]
MQGFLFSAFKKLLSRLFLVLLFICDIRTFLCLFLETLILLINKDSPKLTFLRRSLATEWGIAGAYPLSEKQSAGVL